MPLCHAPHSNFQAAQITLNDELLAAARGGSTKGVAAALSKGAEVDARDENGRTALHRATICANCYLAELLLDNGVSLSARDFTGMTAQYVARDGHVIALLKVSCGSALVVDCTYPYRRTINITIGASRLYAAVCPGCEP